VLSEGLDKITMGRLSANKTFQNWPSKVYGVH